MKTNLLNMRNIDFSIRKEGKWLWKNLAICLAVLLIFAILSFGIASARTAGQSHVYYSLEARNNADRLIKVIDDADSYVYFAIYYFTKSSIADALIRAKHRGVNVIGIMDREASMNANASILGRLKAANVTVLTQRHPEGIMHVKALVTEGAYASGSYNWTDGANNVNDEVLEIGTNESVRKQYLAIIEKLLATNSDKSELLTLKSSEGKSPVIKSIGDGDYDYTEAIDHVGEKATVSGTVTKVFTSKSGTVFLDFCEDFATCPFSAVIFASDVTKFQDLTQYERKLSITGLIKSYQGKAEIILSSPEQIR